MKIKINGKEHVIQPDSSLLDLLVNLNLQAEKGIAVALNQQIIPKSKFEEIRVSENNNITIIRATQGG